MAPALVLALTCCTAGEKEKPTAETAAATGEAPPLIKTLEAPAADVDIKWEEWSAAGLGDAKIDWPAGAACAKSTLYIVGTRKPKGSGAAAKPRAEVVFAKLTPGGLDEVAAYPSQFAERAYASLAPGPGNRLWLIGGMYTPPPLKLVPEGQLNYAELGTPVGEVYVWTPGRADLKLETYLPVPRGKAASTFHDGELYVAGGIFDAANAADQNNRQLHRYDPGEGLWTKLHDIPVPLAQPAAAVARDGLYVIGGKQLKPAYVSNAVYRYDLTVFKWQNMPRLPAPRFAAAAYAVGGYVYVVGGCEAEVLGAPDRMALKSFRFDVAAKRWEELPSPLPEGCMLPAFDGSYFYLVGIHKTYRGRIAKIRR
ncbi:MAG: hypothetical protein GTN49_02055 [candidate division Zixibacteria bacterium]|nr:hypothetical protein [candidate division Zixibacteria bacterium]